VILNAAVFQGLQSLPWAKSKGSRAQPAQCASRTATPPHSGRRLSLKLGELVSCQSGFQSGNLRGRRCHRMWSCTFPDHKACHRCHNRVEEMAADSSWPEPKRRQV